jgi:G3E family GTPase
VTGRLPLHTLTGFLGSGKTTLLNRLLRESALADSVILINEIGAVAIDHYLVEQIAGGKLMDIAVLKGGCTCCTVRGELVEALRELYDRRAQGGMPAFSRAILETTGLADPAPVLFTLASDPVLRHKFEAGTVIATVDAVHGASQLKRYPECRKQVAVADQLMITKSDMVDGAAISRLRAALARINPAADILDAQATPGFEPLLATRGVMGRRFAATAAAQNASKARGLRVQQARHTPGVMALALTLDQPVEWAPFSVWLSLLLHAHGQNILRFKALLDVTGWRGPVMLDGIHHLIHAPIHLPAWPEGPRLSRIVLIVQRIPVQRIETSLREFLGMNATRREPAVAATS